MDYTTVAACLQALRSTKPVSSNPDTGYLGFLVSAVSRDIDHHCTQGVSDGTSDNYFALETKTDELLRGRFDNHGVLKFWPHKPSIGAILALSFRGNPTQPYQTITDFSQTVVTGPMVECYNAANMPTARLSGWNTWGRTLGSIQPSDAFVKVTYTGGLSADTAHLPMDLQLLTTDLVIRIYREERAGIADAIGVENLGVMTYTKQMPVRIARQLQPYMRHVGWNLPN